MTSSSRKSELLLHSASGDDALANPILKAVDLWSAKSSVATMHEPVSGCLICGGELAYGSEAVAVACALCETETSSTVCCEHGHFVCDACHGASALDIIERVCGASPSTDPVQLCTELMRSSAVHMHGPEHHFLVPAVLITAYDNAHGQPERKARHLADARQRAMKVPGGFCGTHGNCGAGVGAGIFWSVVSGATPLSQKPWQQSNRMTAHALLVIADHGGPRCCKRDSYLAIQETMRRATEIDSTRWESRDPTCEHSAKNKQCLKLECTFYGPT